MGEKTMSAYLDAVDKIKSTKIVEAYQAMINPAAATTASTAEATAPAKVRMHLLLSSSPS
jgi:hypothetical protein